jgi:arogenate dehydrogenase (NADP+)
VFAIDAAQPFDFEHRAKRRLDSETRLKVGIVGFGTFGQFLAKRLIARGHQVIATSRTPYENVARQLGVEFFQDPDDFCEEHPEVVLLASSILSTESVLKSLPLLRLKRNTLFVDVLSVKVTTALVCRRQSKAFLIPCPLKHVHRFSPSSCCCGSCLLK